MKHYIHGRTSKHLLSQDFVVLRDMLPLSEGPCNIPFLLLLPSLYFIPFSMPLLGEELHGERQHESRSDPEIQLQLLRATVSLSAELAHGQLISLFTYLYFNVAA